MSAHARVRPVIHASRRSAAIATVLGNGLTVGITIAQAFILIPLSLVHLGPVIYGAWFAASELLVWVQTIDGGVPNLLTQRVGAAVGRGDLDDAARWSSTGLICQLMLGVALGALALIAAPWVGVWARVPEAQAADFVACFSLGAAASTLLMLSNGFVGLSRGVQRTSWIMISQVTGSATGLGISVALLTAGWGLWALALGLLARAVIATAGGLLFMVLLPRARGSWWRHPSWACAREIRSLAPSMWGASVGYVLANHSELLLVTTFLGPLPALVYGLTRRAFDGIRNLLDTVAWAVAGGFAHLVTAADRHRARGVLHEILWLRLALASLAAAVVVAVNEAFVSLLYGAANFGGLWLTAAFALQMILGGQAFLTNFLLRSAGQVREGSWLLAAEAAARVLAISVGLVLGLAGAPIGAAIVSLVSLQVMKRRLDLRLPAAESRSSMGPANMFGPAVVFSSGVVVAMSDLPATWAAVGAVVLAIGLGGGAVLWWAVPAGINRRRLLG